MTTQDEIREKILEWGANDVGFFVDEDVPAPFPNGISIIVRLSEAIVDEIQGKPTHTYFHHYRTVNALIDQLALKTGLLLQKEGFSYVTVAASQSINEGGNSFAGRYSHKKGAVLAGLGTVGKNALFLHKDWGPTVRLGTVFTNYPVNPGAPLGQDPCTGCMKCVKACPALALTGNRDEPIDRKACSDYMKKAFQKIGRGAVCGVCMQVCPARNHQKPH